MTIANTSRTSHRAGWPAFADYRPHPARTILLRRLEEARATTRTLFQAVEAPRLDAVPLMAIVNPPRWELGHVAWFQEFWVHRRGDFDSASMLARADGLYDSSNVAHDTRWQLDLPSFEATWDYLDRVHGLTREVLERGAADAPIDDELAYFVQLAILHHDMHNEAFAYMWHTLGFPAAIEESTPPADPAGQLDIAFPATGFALGSRAGAGFVFDNEKWAHAVEVPAFAVSSRPVSHAEYAAFVDDRGYARRDLWSEAGWDMRETLALQAPRYWKDESGLWHVRRNDRWLALPLDEPVRHVSWHEAQAFCRWAGRRLPTEAEWARAAQDPGFAQSTGRVWEWTDSRFLPYPGFSPDPYRDYSEPWFASDHRVLRGGSFATPLRLKRPGFRNFYPPHRADVFCGFRTCAL